MGLEDRDEYIGWDRETRINVAYLTNNTFLITMGEGTDLASHILGMSHDEYQEIAINMDMSYIVWRHL